ncbi:DUF4221 family protein [uncultured Bacteroides sp.]|uniref:DUF4221 family protein n=1 Tax=uncultured Bacteroides sp. TaxID=162156 RepID=UPI0025FB138D|nr:DUF4221 family protein [uncultured Bacteroides sp.]
MIKILFLLLILSISSCTETYNDTLSLKRSDKEISFSLMDDVKMPFASIFPFEENGEDYISFQNFPKSEILIYSVNTGALVKKVMVETEGNNAVVSGFGGYYIMDMNHIFVPNLGVATICVMDTTATIRQRIDYSKTEQGQRLIPFIPDYKSQMTFVGDSLYVPQTLNGMLGKKTIEESPIRIVIDTTNKKVSTLPMKFPPLITNKDLGTNAAFGMGYSSCYNGHSFIYSFCSDDYLYTTGLAHNQVTKVKAHSRYIRKTEVFRSNENNFQKMIKAQCEHAAYGKIMYDKYRDVYYRFVYPTCEIDDYSGDYVELLRSGRKKNSVMILDRDLNVVGETLLPDYTYNPNLSFVLEDGLYISLNHIMNPTYTDDRLCFQRFELVKNK